MLYNNVFWKKFLNFTLSASIMFTSAVHAQAIPTPTPSIDGPPNVPSAFYAQMKPIINQVVNLKMDAEDAIVTGQAVSASVYLPAIFSPCLFISPLIPVAANATDQCVQLGDYAGTQGPSSLIATVRNGQANMAFTNMPKFPVSVPVGVTNIQPQNQTPINALRVQLSNMTFLTETAEVDAASVNVGNPMAARIAWVLKKALQDEFKNSPDMFPVSILTRQYLAPNPTSSYTQLAFTCAGNLIGSQLTVLGYPYDFQAGDVTARGGNIFLKMKYSQCPESSGRWIRLSDFFKDLKTSPQFQNVEAEAAALVGPSTYHVSDLQVQLPNGQGATVGATVVVVAIGALIIVFIFFPEIVLPSAGWWLLTGAAAAQEQKR